jgi:hypothetical protein
MASEGREDEPAGTDFNFDATIEVEEVIDGIVVVAYCTYAPYHEVSIAGDSHTPLGGMALKGRIACVLEYSYSVPVDICVLSLMICYIEVVCIRRAVVAWYQSEHVIAHTKEGVKKLQPGLNGLTTRVVCKRFL